MKIDFFVWILVFIYSFTLIKAENKEADHEWIKIYYESNGLKRINAHLKSETDSLVYRTDSVANTLRVYTGDDLFILAVDSIESIVLGDNIPTVYIDTDPYVEEIQSKEDYLDASFRYVPYGDGTQPLEQPVKIRGRGNSSWGFPKKPYRLKFDKKQSIGQLNKAKSFVLISNYIDNTLMKNAVAFKIAELLGMPYTNIPQPVNVVFNGIQRGSYMLTNKPGINSGSVDIDETEGILWELDSYYDEEFRYRSAIYKLPCMVKDPDFHEITEDDPEKIEELWKFWQNDMDKTMQAVSQGRWSEVIDAEQFVKYILVQDIVVNRELALPKSIFVFKENMDRKYKFGPVWDFDWALNYSHGVSSNLLHTSNPTYLFFKKIFADSEFRERLQEELDCFCEENLDNLMNFIDDYAALIRDSALQDAILWPAEHFNNDAEKTERNTSRFDENISSLKDFISTRIEFIKNSPNFGLYEN